MEQLKAGGPWFDVNGTNPQFGVVEIAPAAVPEPITLILLATGFAGLGLYRRR